MHSGRLLRRQHGLSAGPVGGEINGFGTDGPPRAGAPTGALPFAAPAAAEREGRSFRQPPAPPPAPQRLPGEAGWDRAPLLQSYRFSCRRSEAAETQRQFLIQEAPACTAPRAEGLRNRRASRRSNGAPAATQRSGCGGGRAGGNGTERMPAKGGRSGVQFLTAIWGVQTDRPSQGLNLVSARQRARTPPRVSV